MPARAYLIDRIVEFEVETGLVQLIPVRWPVLLVVPGLLATPLALFRIYSGRVYDMPKLGWTFALCYSAVAIAMTLVFLWPANRHVKVDLSNRRLMIYEPYGQGVDLDEPLENVDIDYSERATRSGHTVVYTGKLSLR